MSVEAGGGASIAGAGIGGLDVDALAGDPGGGGGEAGEARSGAEFCSRQRDLAIECGEQCDQQSLAELGRAGLVRAMEVARDSSSGGKPRWLRLMPMPMTA